ncbi:UDP binding domain-containing protein, partial [Thermodesulfobacteriota bacterium]
VAKGMGLDNRIGPRFLQAGVGYGGSCFPKDVKSLVTTLKENNCEFDLFEAVNRINEKQISIVVEKLKSVIDVRNSTIGVWGLSFKPKTDDIREAPALKIIEELQSLGAKIHACDPVAIHNAKNVLKDVRFFEDPYETIRDCDALILATEWNQFRNLDMRAVKILLRRPIVIDGRNIYEPKEMRDIGFTYMAVGR